MKTQQQAVDAKKSESGSLVSDNIAFYRLMKTQGKFSGWIILLLSRVQVCYCYVDMLEALLVIRLRIN